MNLKSITTLLLLVLTVSYTYAQEMLLNTTAAATQNYESDNVASMVMDANGNTYVLQNLYDYWTGSNSVGGMTGGLLTDEHSMAVVEKITPAGAVSMVAWVEITSNYSAVTGTALAIGSDGNIYMTGHFYGDIVYATGPYTPRTAHSVVSGTDYGRQMFICQINPAGNVMNAFEDGGTGDEYATCISVAGSNIFVGGYYGVYDNSGTQTTVFDIPTVFPTLSNIGYHNSFILQFNNSLTELAADGYITHSTPDIKLAGIYSTVSGPTITSYVTGSIKGGSTTPSITNTSPGDVMFTGRYVNSADTWTWGVLEGTSYSGTASGGKAITLYNSALFVAGAASYLTGSGPGGYYANSDAVLVRYSNISSNPPTKVFTVPVGGSFNDVANAIVKDATYIYIAGKIDQGNYNRTSTSTTSPFYVTTAVSSSAYSHAFVMKFSIAGVEQWNKVGKTTSTTWPLSNRTGSTAIATNGKCNVAFGGWFKKEVVWDAYTFQKQGSASPDYGHLFVNQVPTQRVTTVPVLTGTNNGAAIPVTASGASLYTWSLTSSGSPLVVSVTGGTVNPATVTQSSGGGTGRWYDLTTSGTYGTGLACVSLARTHVNANMKYEGEEEVTGIEDAVESINTLNVFPNPFTDQVQLDYSFAIQGEGLMQVVDLQGRVIAERVLSSQSSSEIVTTSEWAAGTYIVNLSQAGKTIFTKQIVK